jgi:iron-sulfur cluster repair protein YtfE (RIC family)
MLTRLGAPATPVDAAGLLLECHERIRTFVALARRIAGAAEGNASDRAGIAEAAASVSRYFSQALPLHALDEERSVLPRLRGRAPDVDAALEVMTREHREHERPLSAVVAACDALARDPARLPELAPDLARAAAELDAHFVAHLHREEEIVFPAMRRLLSPEDDAAIVRELRARRAT